jgi:hypothetical protein
MARPRRHAGGLLEKISKRLFAKREVAHDHV